MSRNTTRILSIIGFVLLAVAIFAAIWLYTELTQEPSVDAKKTATSEIYRTIAYEAASTQGALDRGETAQQLMDKNQTRHKELSPDGNSVSWLKQIVGEGHGSGFLTESDMSLRACVRFTADLPSQTVAVVPVACSEMNLPSGFKEINLDPAQIQKARDSRPRTLECKALGEGRSICE